MTTIQRSLQARPRLTSRQTLPLMTRLLFAVLVSAALIVISARPGGATTVTNGIEFGMGTCPSGTVKDSNYTTGHLGIYTTGGYNPSDYNSAFAEWTVPTVTPTADNRYAAFWPGFQDNTRGVIVQAGVADNNVGGQAQYYAWWETFPNGPHLLSQSSYPVHPGDVVFVQITRSDTSDSNWKITITNENKWTFPTAITGFYDPGTPLYEYEIQPGSDPHQMSPQTSPIQIWRTGYTVFGNSNDQYNTWSSGTCGQNQDDVVDAYFSASTNSVGGFTITTAPSAPPYPYTDYGPGVGCCFSFSGTWFEDFSAGGERNQSIVTATGGGQTTASAAWHAQLAAYYWYTVQAYIPPNPGFPLGWAHYYFTDYNHAYTQVGVSQSGNYGRWINLGNWEADGYGHITVQLHNDVNQPGDYLIADAMRFIPVATSYPANTYGPGSGCCFSTTGTWYSGAGHGLIGQEIWAWSNGSTGSATADWKPKLNQSVVYDIKAYIPDYASNGYVHYYITDDSGTTMVSVNQQSYTNAWADLGDFTADSSTGFIDVSLHNDDNGYHTNYVGADAMEFLPVKSCNPACTPTPGSGTVVIGG